MPRLLTAFAVLILAYTGYGFALALRDFHNGQESLGGLIWACLVVGVFGSLICVLVVLARRRRRAVPTSRCPRWIWPLAVWFPLSMFVVGYGFRGSDVAIMFGFPGLLLAPVVAPAVARDRFRGTVTVQSIEVSVPTALFFWPPYIATVFLSFRTGHSVVANVLLAVCGPLFRAIDIIVRRRARKANLNTAQGIKA